MKLKILKENLSRGLAQIAGALPPAPTIPVLGGVLFEMGDDMKLKLTSNNLDFSISCTVEMIEAGKSGKICIPGRKLTQIVSSMPAMEVELNVKKDEVEVSSGKARFKLPLFNPEEFPSFERSEAKDPPCVVNQARLKAALHNVSHAQQVDNTRAALAGSLFEGTKECVNIVATDGKRMAIETIKEGEFAEMRFTIPRAPAAILDGILGSGENVKVFHFDKKAYFHIEPGANSPFVNGVSFSTKCLEEKFPNYQVILPKGLEYTIEVDRVEFLECMNRVSLVVSPKEEVVIIKFTGMFIELTAKSQQFGKAKEDFPISGLELDFGIKINPKYIIAAITSLKDEILAINVGGSRDPMMLETGGYRCVVMPMINT